MKLVRAGLVLFLTMAVASFGFSWALEMLTRAGASHLVLLLVASLRTGSRAAMYGGVILAVSGYAVHATENWLPVGLRLLIFGIGFFFMLEALQVILRALGLSRDAVQFILSAFILVTITLALSGLFVVVASILVLIQKRNHRV